MTVEVFKTNVQKEADKNYVIAVIQSQFPNYKINFDLPVCYSLLPLQSFLQFAEKLLNPYL